MGTKTRVIRKAGSQRLVEFYDNWTGDNNIVFVPEFSFKLRHAAVHFSASITNNCTLSKTAQSDAGSNYDTVITTAINSAGETDNFFVGDDSTVFIEGTGIRLACNVGANIAYGTIVVQEHTLED